ncbi:MAG: hypothetical protein OHK0040_13160 [bacterium]
MKENKLIIVPYFITMQGCRNRCIYCNQALLKEHDKKPSLEELVDQYYRYADGTKDLIIELAFFGGTFLNLSLERRKVLLEQAKQLKLKNKISAVRISTTPDSVSVLKCLEIMDVVDTVELGVQSLDDNLLRLIGRNYDARVVVSATKTLLSFGFKVCHQIMTGLPFETFNSFAGTVKGICALNPHFVRIYPMAFFRDTMLATYFRLGVFRMPSKEELIKRIAFALQSFEKADIRVIRVGLDAFFDNKDAVFSYSESDWRGKAFTFLYGELIRQKIIGRRGDTLTISCGKNTQQYLAKFFKTEKPLLKDIGVERAFFHSLAQKDSKDVNLSLGGQNISISIADLNWAGVDLDFSH